MAASVEKKPWSSTLPRRLLRSLKPSKKAPTHTLIPGSPRGPLPSPTKPDTNSKSQVATVQSSPGGKLYSDYPNVRSEITSALNEMQIVATPDSMLWSSKAYLLGELTDRLPTLARTCHTSTIDGHSRNGIFRLKRLITIDTIAAHCLAPYADKDSIRRTFVVHLPKCYTGPFKVVTFKERMCEEVSFDEIVNYKPRFVTVTQKVERLPKDFDHIELPDVGCVLEVIGIKAVNSPSGLRHVLRVKNEIFNFRLNPDCGGKFQVVEDETEYTLAQILQDFPPEQKIALVRPEHHSDHLLKLVSSQEMHLLLKRELSQEQYVVGEDAATGQEGIVVHVDAGVKFHILCSDLDAPEKTSKFGLKNRGKNLRIENLIYKGTTKPVVCKPVQELFILPPSPQRSMSVDAGNTVPLWITLPSQSKYEKKERNRRKSLDSHIPHKFTPDGPMSIGLPSSRPGGPMTILNKEEYKSLLNPGNRYQSNSEPTKKVPKPLDYKDTERPVQEAEVDEDICEPTVRLTTDNYHQSVQEESEDRLTKEKSYQSGDSFAKDDINYQSIEGPEINFQSEDIPVIEDLYHTVDNPTNEDIYQTVDNLMNKDRNKSEDDQQIEDYYQTVDNFMNEDDITNGKDLKKESENQETTMVDDGDYLIPRKDLVEPIRATATKSAPRTSTTPSNTDYDSLRPLGVSTPIDNSQTLGEVLYASIDHHDTSVTPRELGIDDYDSSQLLNATIDHDTSKLQESTSQGEPTSLNSFEEYVSTVHENTPRSLKISATDENDSSTSLGSPDYHLDSHIPHKFTPDGPMSIVLPSSRPGGPMMILNKEEYKSLLNPGNRYQSNSGPTTKVPNPLDYKDTERPVQEAEVDEDICEPIVRLTTDNYHQSVQEDFEERLTKEKSYQSGDSFAKDDINYQSIEGPEINYQSEDIPVIEDLYHTVDNPTNEDIYQTVDNLMNKGRNKSEDDQQIEDYYQTVDNFMNEDDITNRKDLKKESENQETTMVDDGDYLIPRKDQVEPILATATKSAHRTSKSPFTDYNSLRPLRELGIDDYDSSQIINATIDHDTSKLQEESTPLTVDNLMNKGRNTSEDDQHIEDNYQTMDNCMNEDDITNRKDLKKESENQETTMVDDGDYLIPRKDQVEPILATATKSAHRTSKSPSTDYDSLRPLGVSAPIDDPQSLGEVVYASIDHHDTSVTPRELGIDDYDSSQIINATIDHDTSKLQEESTPLTVDNLMNKGRNTSEDDQQIEDNYQTVDNCMNEDDITNRKDLKKESENQETTMVDDGDYLIPRKDQMEPILATATKSAHRTSKSPSTDYDSLRPLGVSAPIDDPQSLGEVVYASIDHHDTSVTPRELGIDDYDSSQIIYATIDHDTSKLQEESTPHGESTSLNLCEEYVSAVYENTPRSLKIPATDENDSSTSLGSPDYDSPNSLGKSTFIDHNTYKSLEESASDDYDYPKSFVKFDSPDHDSPKSLEESVSPIYENMSRSLKTSATDENDRPMVFPTE